MRYERARNAAVLLGAGLGGMLDGIALHQVNMLAERSLQSAIWLLMLGGVILLWSTIRGAGRLPTTRSFCGYLLAGWGGFGLLEGIVNHHLLERHHLGLEPLYDWLFLLFSAGLVLGGLALRDGLGRPYTERRSGIDRRSVIS
jgi:uncharacterized membrane protein